MKQFLPTLAALAALLPLFTAHRAEAVALQTQTQFVVVVTNQPTVGEYLQVFTNLPGAEATLMFGPPVPGAGITNVGIDPVNGYYSTATNLYQALVYMGDPGITATVTNNIITVTAQPGLFRLGAIFDNVGPTSYNGTTQYIDFGYCYNVTNTALPVAMSGGTLYPDGSFQTNAFTGTKIGANVSPSFSSQIVMTYGPANTNLVSAGPYTGQVLGGTNVWGPSSGITRLDVLYTNHTSRLMAIGGSVAGAEVCVGPTNGMTGFWVDVWQQGSFVLQGSQSAWPLVPAATNAVTFSTAIVANEGDYIGFHATFDGVTTETNFPVTNSLSGVTITNSSGIANGFAWLSQPSVSGLPAIQALSAAPYVVWLGPSDMSGWTNTSDFADTQNLRDGPQAWVSTLSAWLGVTAQNRSIGGQTTANLMGRIGTDGTNLYPRAIVLGDALNDLSGSTVSSIMANYTNFVTDCLQTGITPIIQLCNPAYGSSDVGTLTLLTNMLAVNADLYSMQGVFSNLVLLDFTGALGQPVTTGPLGNLGLRQAAFDPGDHIHLTQAGQTRVATTAFQQLNSLAPMNVYGPASINGPTRANGQIVSYWPGAGTDYTAPNLAFGTDSNHFMTMSATAQAAFIEGVNLGIGYLQVVIDRHGGGVSLGVTNAFAGAELGVEGNLAVQGGSIYLGLPASGVGWLAGSGSPVGTVSATAGSFYINTSGGATNTFWVKESGSGTSGWVNK